LGPLLRLCSALALLLIPMAASAAIAPHQLAVIINEDDPDSFKLGQYYAQQRGIPPENIVQVPLGIPKAEISPEAFDRAYIKVRINTRERIEGYALAFTYPYRVGCMSITTAFAMGYGKRFCADGCHPTAPNPYFDEEGGQPWETFGLHPTMMLAAKSLESGKRLVDRGVASDGTKPTGHAYLVVTSDATRSTRARQFPIAKAVWGDRFSTSIEQTDGIRDKRDVMFYFTGTPQVPYLDTLRFLPGAIADHLTSSGGQLDGNKCPRWPGWKPAPPRVTARWPSPAISPRNFRTPASSCAPTSAGTPRLKPIGKAWCGRGRGFLLVSRWRAPSVL